VLKKGWALLAQHLLRVSLMFERRMWDYETPLRQFPTEISYEVMSKLERLKPPLTIDRIRETSADDLGRLVRHQSYGPILKRLAETLPAVEVEASLRPITRTVLMVQAEVRPAFRWDDRHHGKVCESFWLWLSDIDSNHIYHSELFKLTKKQVQRRESQKLTFNIPLLDPDHLPSQYIIHCAFDRWLGCELDVSLPCRQLILPEKYVPYTKLLDLDPLPVSALNNTLYESIYRFSHFNPIQTQIFHTLYHTDGNVLVGAPTGSGKTICAEMAMFRTFTTNPGAKVVYIAPLKALVRERVDDWRLKLEQTMGRRVVELTGDVTPDVRAIMAADVIVTTPEKWDGISRSWQQRRYVRDVALIVIDEIHLLGEDRGPVLEVIVSRTNFIRQNSDQKIRIVGLSTAIANAQDLANWLDIKGIGLYNFNPSVRPVPIEVHVQGFPGKNYCPRMALMNKPTYRAILHHSPTKPVLIFVSSRRQTRLTAYDLMTFLANDSANDRFLRMDRREMSALIANVRDSSLKTTLDFGIGLHHAGLHERDRCLVEELFANQKIQVLVSTATLAWGVNLPAHAVTNSYHF
jgi:activating signal cointegrator complex subunit 3